MRTTEQDIKTLIEQCLDYDSAAQYELYSRYSKAMYSTSVRILGNNEDAQDALQDAFINAFKNLKKFDHRVTFGAWLKRITINVCLNKVRKKKLKWLELDFDIPDMNDDEPLQIEVTDLNQAIEKLPSGCKMVFSLKTLEGYTHEEIAKALNISLSTSKSQFIRAKKLLRFSLQKVIQLNTNH